MKAKVTKILIKWGYNAEDAQAMADAHTDYVMATYEDAKTPAKIANIVTAL